MRADFDSGLGIGADLLGSDGGGRMVLEDLLGVKGSSSPASYARRPRSSSRTTTGRTIPPPRALTSNSRRACGDRTACSTAATLRPLRRNGTLAGLLVAPGSQAAVGL